MAQPPIFTIGYGKRSLDDFVAQLQRHTVRILGDVRSHPYSRFKPEFSREVLRARLEQSDITYLFLGDQLGGRPTDQACYSQGKVDYEKCRQHANFQQGIDRLCTVWEQDPRIALMCSEGKPEECHRSKLVGLALCERDIPIRHIDEHGDLLTQDQVIQRITGGQLYLFGTPPELLTSRKRYASSPEGDEEDDA